MSLERWLKQITTTCVFVPLLACTPIETVTAPQSTEDVETAEEAPEASPAERCWAPAPAEARASVASQNVDQTAEPAAQPLRLDLNEGWFETLCPDVLTSDFVSALQRALAARDYFNAPISGDIDAATRSAISAFQADRGLDSDTLSIEAARALGLVAIARPEDS